MSQSRTRVRLRAVAAETVSIVEAGGYHTPDGAWVDIAMPTTAAVAGTRLHLPNDPLPAEASSNPAPLVEVTNESTLAAARRIGGEAAALVFASARNPGGGFLSGARAQEEDIARASALHACLAAVPSFYEHHRAEKDLRYSNRIIYSPKVPVFRDDTGQLLDQPYQLGMITAAAPNLRAVQSNQPHLAGSVPEVVCDRAVRVLQVAAAHGERRLVLGAWGCGVFGNDPAVVAGAFATALRLIDKFDQVVFAVLDRSPELATYRAFAQAFDYR